MDARPFSGVERSCHRIEQRGRKIQIAVSRDRTEGEIMSQQRRLTQFLIFITGFTLWAGPKAHAGSGEAAPSQPPVAHAFKLPVDVPAPADNPTTPARVALGKMLFFDPRLS